MKQTRTLTFEKTYDPAEERCKFTNQGSETTPEVIAEEILEYLRQMCGNHRDAKISVSFREEV
jgi:hypothetical protein